MKYKRLYSFGTSIKKCERNGGGALIRLKLAFTILANIGALGKAESGDIAFLPPYSYEFRASTHRLT